MKKALILALTTLLAVTLLLSACDLLTDPFPNETYTDTIICYPDTETGSNIHIGETIPAPDTELPTETDEATMPDETDTEPETWIPSMKTMRGCICGYDENLQPKIKLSGQYKGERGVEVYVWVENPHDFGMFGDVIFEYDANRPVETAPTGEDILIAVSMEYDRYADMTDKPVIYLYPETSTEVSVKLTVDGKLTCTYPAYDKGWDNFTAYPDGTLVFPDGKEYYCLYWEALQDNEYDFTKGFCVKGTDTAAFLEWALSEQGLTPREANEFIIYWLPRMEQNPYNVISFQTESYTEGAVLEIAPNPDSLLRVFMAWYPSDEAVEIEAQAFTSFERVGFTVVEWGGSELIGKP